MSPMPKRAVGTGSSSPLLPSLLLLAALLWLCPPAGALSMTKTASLCPVAPNVTRNWTCPAPVLSNITEPPFVNGSWSVNKYNKSWDVEWFTEYNKSIDGTGECGSDLNPGNYFNRDCDWELACNIPNVTNGSVLFYNLTVDLLTPTRRLDTQVFFDLTFMRDNNITGPETLFYMHNRTITGFTQAGTDKNFVFPNAAVRIPNVALGSGYVITSNWRERAYIKARFYTNNVSGPLIYQPDIGINLTMHFECNQFIVNVTVFTDPDFLGIALGIPFALIALIILLACLKYKYPQLFDCCCKKKDGNENFDDDEAILAAARAKRDNRDLGKPLVELQDKAGMQTWLDQAEDVVEDLNRNCVYLEEAKTDSQMNKGFDALEGTGGNPSLSAHKDGFVGGRQLYAVGGATGGVKVVDHKPKMQTRGGGDEDIVL